MRRIMLIFSMLIMGFIGVNSANAAVITEDKIANVYANQNYNGKELSASFGYMYADGFIAYCIDPGVSLKIGEYQKNYNFNFKNIDKKKKEKLELISSPPLFLKVVKLTFVEPIISQIKACVA